MSLWLDALERGLSNPDGFVTEVEGGRHLPYPQLRDLSRHWDAFLHPADRRIISVVLPNGIDYLAVYLATLRSRNIFSPVPYFVAAVELEKVLEYVNPALLITDREDLKERFGQRLPVISPQEAAATPLAPAMERDVTGSEIACLYYSSGTTGNPKGVLYSHDNVFHLIASINRGFRFDAGTRQFAFLPFGHTASINYNILPALMAGGPLFTSKGFDQLRANFFQVLAQHRISYTELVPSVLLMLIKLQHKVAGLDLSALEFVGCGSSTLSLETQKRFMEMYGLRVGNLYGLSETGPSHIDDPREAGWEPGSIGRPLDVNQCRVSADGELLLKGPNVFVGYYHNDALYQEVVKDGWFHTGDLGYQEGERFFFQDRKKDLIIKSGINIVPAEIEETVYKCVEVLECVAVGKPDPVHGENVAVAAVPKDPARAGELAAAIRAVCKAHLSPYKAPVEIRVVEAIPKTHSGKLLRKKVRDWFAH